MKPLNIHAPGTRVLIGPDGIEGTIVSACITKGRITYECVWWDGRSRVNEWMTELEFRPARKDAVRTGIGFNDV